MDQDTRLILESLFLLLRAANISAPHSTRGDTIARQCGERADAINNRLREHDAEAEKFNGAKT